MTYSFHHESIDHGRAQRITIAREGHPLTYDDVLDGWEGDPVFRNGFDELLRACPFQAYRWETPPITASMSNRLFECVLREASLDSRPDVATFSRYFDDDRDGQGVVAFENLGRDATLIVPTPMGPHDGYSHLALFQRSAPQAQRHRLWEVVGSETKRRLNERPLWVSTAGGGVAWLHVRLDTYPKYYGHAPYRTFLEV